MKLKKLGILIILLVLSAGLYAQPRKVVLQVFWWDYYHQNYPNAWANYLIELAPRLKDMGVDAVWIPPTPKNGFTYGVGYAPFDNYDLGDKFQKGATRTRVGTKDELLRMIAVMHANGIEVIQDVVMNHVIGAGSDTGGGGKDTSPFGSEPWTNFRYTSWASPATDQSFADYSNRMGRFYKTRWNFHPNPDFNCTTGDWCEAYWGPDIAYTDGSKGESSNMGAPNITGWQTDQTAQASYSGNYMKGETNRWIVWYKKQTGFDGVRMDAIKHFDYSASEGMLWNLQNNAGWASGGNNMFAVGEFVSGASDLDMWVAAVNNRAGTFDFGLRGFTGQGLQGVTSAGGNYYLGNLPNEQQNNRARTVPFVNNHDTFRPILAANGNYSKPLGDDSGWSLGSQLGKHIDPRDPRLSVTYAVALAVDGSPQIFFEDLFDVGTTGMRFTHDPKSNAELPVRDDLANLLWCRQALDFMGGAYRVRWQAADALVIERSNKALIATNDNWNTWQNLNGVQTDFPDGTQLKDYSGANETAVRTVYGGGKVDISIPPCDGTANAGRRGYAVWAPVGQDGNTYTPPRSTVTTQEWEMADDLGDSHCQSLGQGGALPANSTVQRLVGKIYVQAGKAITPELFPVDNTKEVYVGLYDVKGKLLASAHNTAGSGLTSFNYTPTSTGWVSIKIWNKVNTNPAQRAFVKVSYTAPTTITDAQVTAEKSDNQVVIWTGAWSNEWDECRNWEQGILPNASLDVIIPSMNNTNQINITGELVCKNFTVEDGNTVNVTGAGKITIGQDLTIEGNIVNAGTINVADEVIAQAGGTNTVSGAGTINATNSLKVNKNASNITWTLANTTAKSFEQAQGGFIFSNAGSKLNLTGNFAKTGGTFTHSNGEFIFKNPSALQTIQSNDVPTFYQLKVDKAGGDLKLLSNIQVSNLAFVSIGDVDLNGQTLDLGTTGTLQEDLTNNHLVKDLTGTGKVTRQNLTFDNSTAGTDLAGLGLSLSQTSGSVTISVERQHQRLNSVTTVITRNYKVTTTSGSFNNATLKIKYASQEQTGVTALESNFKILNWNGTNFTDLGGTVNVATNEVTATNVTDPSTFTVGELKTDVTVSVTPTSLAENSGSNFTVNFSRGTTTVGDLVVNFAVKGTASHLTDYTVSNALIFTSANGAVMIPNGQSNVNVFMTVKDDLIDEGTSETVILELLNDAAYTIGTPNTATATITDNDNAGFTVQVEGSNETTRAGGTAVFSVRLNTPPSANVTTNLSSSDGTNGGTIGTGSLTFTPTNWNTKQFVTVTGAGGGTGDVNYDIQTAAATSGDEQYNGTDPADASFVNKDVVYNVQIYKGANPAEPSTAGSFFVTVTPAPTSNLTINWAVTGTATGSGTDYNLATGTNTSAVGTGSFTLASGQNTGTITINPVTDATAEGGETIIATLNAGTGYTFSTASSATLTIDDNNSITVNGTNDAGEYAWSANNWSMNWDDTNLYILIQLADVKEGAVLYLDKDMLVPINGGTNADGTSVGNAYDGTNFAELPFRADLVVYFKNGYQEYRTADGSNGWSGATTTFGSYAESGGNIREIAIPWSAIGGKPDKFAWYGYVTSGGGFVYNQNPTNNAGSNIGTTARYERYFAVHATDDSVNPFSRESYVFNATASNNTFEAISVYDFTMNTNALQIARLNSGGDWTINGDMVINNGSVYFGLGGNAGYGTTNINNLKVSGGLLDADATDKPINVTGNIALSGGTLELSTTIGSDINLSGNWNKSGGTFTHNDRAINFTGTNPQTVTHNAGNFSYLVINKSSNTVKLMSDMTATQTVTLTQGDLDLNGRTLTLGTTGSLAEDRANNHLVIDSQGTGSITASRTGISTLTDIAGMGFSADGTGLNLTVTRRHNKLTNAITKNYQISGVSGTIGGNVDVEYASDELNGLTAFNLRMVTAQGSNVAFQGGTVNTGTRKVSTTGVTAFGSSRWTAGVAPKIELESPVSTVVANNGTRASVGSAGVGQSINVTVRLKNIGAGNLSIQAMNLGGTNASDFSIPNVTTFPFDIATNQDVTLRFTPSATGTRNAILTVVSSDKTTPNYVINLSGIGLENPEIDIESPVNTAVAAGNLVDYGAKNLNSNTDQVFRLKNTGGADLVVSNANISGANASDFTVQGGVSLPFTTLGGAAGFGDVTLRFTPSGSGNRFATIVFYNNDNNEGIYTVNLKGEGVTSFITIESPISTWVETGTDRMAFQSVIVGQNSDYTFRVRNTGTPNLNLSNLTILGTNASDFSIVSPPTYPQVVAGSGQYDFTIRFQPTATGVKNATLKFESDDPNIPNYFINISGMGVTPEIDVFYENGASFASDASYQYAEMATGQTQDESFKIRNTGNAFLTISGATFTPATDFGFNPTVTFPLHVAPNAETFVTVRVSPGTTGLKTSTLALANDDPNENPYRLFLTAQVTSPPTIVVKTTATIAHNNFTPSTANYTDFGTRLFGSSFITSYLIENTGGSPLNVSSISFSGAHASDFSIENLPPSSIPAGATNPFAVKFTPSGSGLRTAFITIPSNDASTPNYYFAIQGTGTTPPDINLSQGGTALANGSGAYTFVTVQTQNTSSPAIAFTVTNPGAVDLLLNGSGKVQLSSLDFTLNASSTSTTVSASGTTTFEVSFTPQSGGFKTATVTIINNSASKNPYTFQVRGEAIAVATPPMPTPTPAPTGGTTTTTTTTDLINILADVPTVIQFAGEGQVIDLPATVNDVPVTYVVTSGNAFVQGNQLYITGAGEVQITAISGGTSPVSHNFGITVEKGSQTLTDSDLKVIPEIPQNSQGVTPDFGAEGLEFEIISGQELATIDANGNIVPTGNGVGEVKIRVRKPASDNFNASEWVEITVIIAKANQTITFGNLANRTFALNETFELSATASSGLPVVFEALTDNISISGNTVTILGAGQAQIKAVQAGNELYNPALDVIRIFTINKASQTIDFAEITNKAFTDAVFNISASTSSGLPVTFEVIRGQDVVELNGMLVSIIGSGDVQIRATQAGNENYLPAQAVSRHFAVSPVIVLNSVNLDLDNYTLVVNFDINGIINNGQILIQISDENGSFDNPQYFYATIDASTGQAIIQIPAGITASGDYRIRILNTGSGSTTNILDISQPLNPRPKTSWIQRDGTTLCASEEADSYQWYVRNEAGEWEEIAGETNRCIDMQVAFGRTENERQVVAVQGFMGNRAGNLSTPYGYQEVAEVLANESEIVDGLHIYPNPTSGKFAIELTLKKSGDVHMKLVDVSGKEIYPKSFENMPIHFVQHYDIELLANGVYFLHIQTEQGTVIRKIVKE